MLLHSNEDIVHPLIYYFKYILKKISKIIQTQIIVLIINLIVPHGNKHCRNTINQINKVSDHCLKIFLHLINFKFYKLNY